jgi:hypothetical protein
MTITKLTTIIGATGAYACIKEVQDDGFVRTSDIRLTRTGSLRKQLLEEVDDMYEKAARIIDRADLIKRAVATIEEE